MISILYVLLLAMLIIGLVANVIKARMTNQIAYGDGGINQLVLARSAHSNAIETIPIGLILLLALELNGGTGWLIHLFGISFIIGRFLHVKGVLSNILKVRVIGMQITLFTMAGMIIANFVLLPYETIFHL